MTPKLDDKARPALRDIVVENGRSLLRDRARLNYLLKDFCPGCNYEIELILHAVDDGVPAALLDAGQPSRKQIAELAQRLESRRGLSHENAEWAVNSWVFALGIAVKPDVLPKEPVQLPKEPAKAVEQPRMIIRENPYAADNRSAGWKRFYVSILLLLFIGGGGIWAAANQAEGTLGTVLYAICGILGLTALTGLYKGITGR